MTEIMNAATELSPYIQDKMIREVLKGASVDIDLTHSTREGGVIVNDTPATIALRLAGVQPPLFGEESLAKLRQAGLEV